MRISDWSSDVCSSDLLSASFHSLSHVFTMLARPLIDIHLAISSTSALGFSSKNSSREGDNLPLSNGRGKPFSVNSLGIHPSCWSLSTRCLGDPRLNSTSSNARYVPSPRSEEHTSELQSLMRNSYAVLCLKKKTTYNNNTLYHSKQI